MNWFRRLETLLLLILAKQKQIEASETTTQNKLDKLMLVQGNIVLLVTSQGQALALQADKLKEIQSAVKQILADITPPPQNPTGFTAELTINSINP